MRFNIQTDNISFPSLAGQKKNNLEHCTTKQYLIGLFLEPTEYHFWMEKPPKEEASPTCIYPAKDHSNYPSTLWQTNSNLPVSSTVITPCNLNEDDKEL